MVDIRGLGGLEAMRGLSPVAVGTKGVRPVIGVKAESPGFAMEMGVNMERFAPGIMVIDPIPERGTRIQHENTMTHT